MTVSLKHAFQSAKGDGADATRVQPSNWNAEHTLTLATDKLLGRATAGTGAVEEVACTSAGRQILAAADIAAIQALLGIAGAFSTGDVKLTFKNAADTGWVMMNDGTLGNASSGGTARANADTEALFTLLWNNISNTYAPVSGGRGANAAADFAANKTIALTKVLGRALGVAGAGSGLTSRALGETLGVETHALSTGEMPTHTHSVTDPGHGHDMIKNGNQSASISVGNPTGSCPFDAGNSQCASTTISVASNTTGISIGNAGSGSAHNNMQPSSFFNAMIKL